MSVWAKLIWDGSLSVGETVTAPGYTLGPDSDPTDGWQQYPSIEAAEAALGVTDDPVAALQAQVERLATLLAALTDAQSLEEIRDAAAAAGGGN